MSARTAGAGANRYRLEVVDYHGDPAAEARTRSLVGGILARANGFYGPVIGNDDGSPQNTFSGRGPQTQSFRGALSRGSNAIIYRDVESATIETGLSDSSADPVHQLLAARLRRRR